MDFTVLIRIISHHRHYHPPDFAINLSKSVFVIVPADPATQLSVVALRYLQFPDYS